MFSMTVVSEEDDALMKTKGILTEIIDIADPVEFSVTFFTLDGLT